MTEAEPRGPWPELRLDVARLRQRDDLRQLKRQGSVDSTRKVSVEVEAHGIEVSTSRVLDGSPIVVEGELEAALGSVEFEGTVSTSWEGECRRCLEAVQGAVELQLSVSFLPDLSDGADVEAYPILGDYVDLGEAIREELMLALPLSPLCEDGCDGADPERYPTTLSDVAEESSEGDDEGDRPVDPRWAALSALTFDEE